MRTRTHTLYEVPENPPSCRHLPSSPEILGKS